MPGRLLRWIAIGLVAMAFALGLGSLLSARGEKSAVSSAPQQLATAPDSAAVRNLRSFGAIGDGKSDDSAAIIKAFAAGGGFCLDGESRRYSVRGSMRAATDLCLRNATLVQTEPPLDSRPYVRASCPLVTDAAAEVDCGDPAMTPEADLPFLQSLATRTLFIRPEEGRPRLKVQLSNVTIDRGSNPTAGSRSDAAGIWIDGADRIDLDGVEVTGMGRGFGLMIADSRNVRIRNLKVHDLTWAPYPPDLAKISLERLKQGGWNNATVREYRPSRAGGRGAGFVGVRVQEQLSCVFLTRVEHVQIDDLTIKNCLARVGNEHFPWQADGLGIGAGVSDITVNRGTIDTTWEAIDLGTGDGGSGFTIRDMKIANSFSYGIKVGFRLSDLLISNVVISNAGLGGIDLRGAVDRAIIERTTINETGVVLDGAGSVMPWPLAARAGIRLQRVGDNTQPRNVIIRGVRIRNPTSPGAYAIGIRSDGSGGQFRLIDVNARDFSRSEVLHDP